MASCLRAPFIGLFVGLACCAQTPAIDPAVLQMLPPDAVFLVGIEWRKILETGAGESIQKAIRDSGISSIPGLKGLEKTLLEDVDSFTMGAPPQMFRKNTKQAPILTVVKGRFDRAELRELLQGKVEIYRRAELIEPAGASPPTSRVALLDGNTMLVGDRPDVMAALDRQVAPPPTGPPNRLFDRAGALAGQYDVWLALKAPPGGFPVPDNPQAQVVSQLNGLELGMSFTQGLQLEANLRAKSVESAKSVSAAIQGLLAVAALQQQTAAQGADLLRKVEVRETASTVRIRLSLTEAEVAQSLKSMPTAAPLPRPAVKPSEPQGPRKIRIIGLEGGTKEVLIPANKP